MNFSSQSSLALSFEEALCPSRLLSQITLAAETQLRAQITESGNRALGLAVATANFFVRAGTVEVVFQGGIPAGAKFMNSAGKAMPVLVDGKTGRILKLGRVTSKGRTAASLAANAPLIIFEAAHMISGYDNAKTLKKVESSVDLLVHAHHSELKSRLEAVYRYCKELLHHGPDSLSDEDRRELHRQCRELIELRARWRDDFRHRIGKINPADPGFLNRVFWWRRDESYQQNRQSKAKESTEALEIVELMHFSLMLQMALAGSAGKMDSFRRLTLPDECGSWRSLAKFGRVRAEEIAGDKGKQEFSRFLDSLDGLVDFWTPSEQVERPMPKAAKRVIGVKLSKRSTLYDTPLNGRK